MAAVLTSTYSVPARSRIGRIHSVESLGAVDGPGLRCVVFTQGCLMRCRYCHNPDTWALHGGTAVTAGSLIDEIKGYLPFMKASKGGITVSGGEPLLQAPFVAGLFEEAHRLGIHTALDTNGLLTPEEADPVLDHTDLVLLDIKQMDPVKHKALTAQPLEPTLAMARHLADRRIPVWIRYVVVPGWTDAPEDVAALGDFVATLPNVEKVELLPYHLLGKHKWETLKIPYSLNGVEPPSAEVLERITRQLAERGICVE